MSLLVSLRDLLIGTGPDDVPRRRTTYFAVAVVVLLFVARAGASSALFAVAMAAFAATATVWVRGQYARYLRGTPAVATWWSYLVVLVVAAGLGAAYVELRHEHEHPMGGLLLGGIVVGYFAIGGLIAVWRESGRGLLPFGIGLGVLAFLLVAGGYLVLAHSDTGNLKFGGGLLVLGLLACWPVSVALLSERATTFFSEVGPDVWRWVAMAVGLIGYVVVVVATYAVTGSTGTLLGLLALGGLIVSVASSTRADIVLIIVLLAGMGFSPGDANVPSFPLHTDKPVLVALGDSYMSGEGASIYYSGTDTAGKDQCRRAPTAWAVQAGRVPPFGGGTLFLACSGAVSANIRTSTPSDAALAQPGTQLGESGPQLAQLQDELKADPGLDVGLVVLSIGGNDAGFSTIGTMCLMPGDCATKDYWWTQGLSYVSQSLSVTYDQVRAMFPDTPVVVTAYPDPIYRPAPTTASAKPTKVRTCHQVALRSDEQVFVESFLDKLNQTVQTQAAAHGFYYLGDMQYALRDAGLQLCDPQNNGRPGLNFIGLRSVGGLAEQRFNPANWTHNSLHPNERGHLAMLQTFERWYAENSPLLPTAPTPPVGTGDGTGTAGPVLPPPPEFSPVCSPLDPTPTGCRSRGTHWAVSNVADALVTPRAGVVVLAALLLWVGVLAFFGWHRRRWQHAPDKVNLV